MITIRGFVKTSLLNYPGKISALIFLGGCNFHCPYCHNTSLLSPPDDYEVLPTPEEVLNILSKRRNLLEGVVISGGEPTINKLEDIATLCKRIKELGYPIKLDTNGSNPKVIKYLVEEKLIDYVAMDIKSPIEKYGEVTCNSKLDIESIKESVEYLKKDNVDYEFRTTVMKEFISETDIESISEWIKGAKRMFLQNYKWTPECKRKYTPCSEEELVHYKSILERNVETVGIRNI